MIVARRLLFVHIHKFCPLFLLISRRLDQMDYITLIPIIALIAMSGLFSGLTLGLLSLDTNQLKVSTIILTLVVVNL